MNAQNNIIKMLCSILLALSLIIGFATTPSATALAAEAISINTSTSPMNTLSREVHYPISGLSSGVFSGNDSEPAKFNLPARTIYVNYSFDSRITGTMTISGNGRVYSLVISPGNGSRSFDVETAGVYTITLHTGAGGYGATKTYGYSLYSYSN